MTNLQLRPQRYPTDCALDPNIELDQDVLQDLECNRDFLTGFQLSSKGVFILDICNPGDEIKVSRSMV